MRWSLRRADRASSDRARGADPHPEPAGRPETGAAPDGAVEPTELDWRALAPIAPTWAPQTPLTTPQQQFRPPLLQRRARLTAATPADGAPEPGRVIGLAAARPIITPVVRPAVRAPADHATPAGPADQPIGYLARRVPLRHVTPRPIVEHQPLTSATPDYVGEPVAPAPPPPPIAPARLRARPNVGNDAKTEAGARFQEALADLSRRGLPQYIEGGTLIEPPPEPPVVPDIPGMRALSNGQFEWRAPDAGEPDRSQGPALRPDPNLTHRRRSLAESRRLGLGTPLQRDAPAPEADRGAADHAQSDEEPARAVAPEPPRDGLPPAPPSPPAAPTPPADPGPAATAAPVDTGEPPPPRRASATPLRDDDSRADDDASQPLGPRDALTPTVTARPIDDATPRPVASTIPLVFRATPADPHAAPAASAAAPAPVVTPIVTPAAAPSPARQVSASAPPAVTRAPAELAQALRSSHGIDVGDVAVIRDHDTGTEARRRRARAFTRGGQVHLPEGAGPITSSQARGLLAHELVHAAQQRRLGGSLPDENTPEGRALEAAARAAERMYSANTEHFEEPKLVHAPVPVTAGWVETRIVQHASEVIDYFDENVPLSTSQNDMWLETALGAVDQVMTDYRNRGGNPDPDPDSRFGPFRNLSEERTAEQDFLDVVNAELDRRGEPIQAGLSDDDRAAVLQMMTRAAGNVPGSGQGAGPGRRGAQSGSAPLSDAERWQQQNLGSTTALGADIGGLLAWTPWGRPDPQASGTGTALGTGSTAGHDTGGASQQGHGSSFLQDLIGSDGSSSSSSAQVSSASNADAASTAQRSTMSQFFADLTGDNASSGSESAGRGRASGSHPTDDDQSRFGTFMADLLGGHETASARQPESDPATDFDEPDLEELATKIYDRLRSRLRRELIVDRERAGLLTDFR